MLHAFVDFSFGAELGHSQKFPNDFRSYRHLFRFAFSDSPSLFAGDRSDLAFQVSHTGLSREAVDNLFQAFFGELNLFAKFQAVFSGLFGNQVAVRNVDFLFAGVAWQFDDLHAVAQRLRNRIHPVCRGDENHLGQIERNIQVVITERRILLRIKHCHQRR